ncbi:4-amino-4-deoxy-L-arabinose-phosphoundecaprenol flippase subunit ArnF [Erwiniaceae bacterium BAC15a-03b]|uniref:Probable 4-amino-4-deoxy-L-arabinose-phosphoundecaprenol flippase subunit ArnF n=1 Tax=Winslowiella arboricola TaxID=2978220 RepID=A0A9J6PZS4_9GAMM|nr:4-amino-4-deoxy-L-arabinose-phosphoundecaprenol flippase subunit ArnF [Winslowiella arboricola]MCU5775647.1 4-amino-4-deoxy-L-arabinose-phosphoundecaprenol flippase subunit ArnF [Winslowiella arboricola]MCU5779503.1 4-amino-4-deoxy-L-arabinose-phosphoundecaprenol flippase subunit ArnF [Winslowiella arboricola]
MKGYFLALCSVLLVTAAQLMLRRAMTDLPSLDAITAWRSVSPQPVLLLLGGLTSYALSVLCWLFALRRLPLSHAYPLLSLSYILVWLLAILLPAFAEPFHFRALVGVGLIMLGLLCICVQSSEKKDGGHL